MIYATATQSVRFVEVPRLTGISNFLVEFETGEPVGWLSFDKSNDEWIAAVNFPLTSGMVRERFAHREDGERWVRSQLQRG